MIFKTNWKLVHKILSLNTILILHLNLKYRIENKISCLKEILCQNFMSLKCMYVGHTNLTIEHEILLSNFKFERESWFYVQIWSELEFLCWISKFYDWMWNFKFEEIDFQTRSLYMNIRVPWRSAQTLSTLTFF